LIPVERLRSLQALIAAAGLALAAVIYLGWEWAHRGIATYAAVTYPFNDADEWRYMSCSRLVLDGYALFTQVFSAQPPLLFASLAGGMRLFGDSLQGAHLTESAFGLLGLASACWLAWLLSGTIAAAFTGLLLSVCPLFLVYSRAIEAEGPMSALMTLGIALCMWYRRRGGLWIPALAGAVIAGAILFKLFAVAAILPAGWIVVSRPGTVRQRATRVVSFALGVVVPGVIDLAAIAPAAQWDQVVRFHEKADSVVMAGAPPASTLFGAFIEAAPGLCAFAVAGIVLLAVRQRWFELSVLVVWGLAFGGMLVSFHPLFQHHLAILLTLAGVTAGCGVGEAWEGLLTGHASDVLPVVVAALIFLVTAPAMIHMDRHTLVPLPAGGSVALAAYFDAHTTAGDFVATDDAEAAVLAARLVPPGLCDPSIVRLLAGYLPASELVGQTQAYHARLAAPRATFVQVPAYLRWLDSHYRVEQTQAGQIFVRR
jgi:4-amino-4-deoxy-L-arabinose transferase-like glycosyltransferase